MKEQSKNISGSACGHPLQDFDYRFIEYPASELIEEPFLAVPFQSFTSGTGLGCRPTVGSLQFLSVPFLGKGPVALPSQTLIFWSFERRTFSKCHIGLCSPRSHTTPRKLCCQILVHKCFEESSRASSQLFVIDFSSKRIKILKFGSFKL